ncbi:TIGR03915 family putative DNA repair protein [Treponema primitia]|uniref:TIGR03915 family putative DNA repair protein n=1 Tax=Treponema primitia TaxID=88058 RepID=UPI0002554CB0|nr:TIGR03915 family putative DNA repair protein [Treponema primitia]
MIEYTYDGTLEGLFTVLDRICRSLDPEAAIPDHVHGPLRQGWKTQPVDTAQAPAAQPDLFDGGTSSEASRGTETASGEVPASSAQTISFKPSVYTGSCVVSSGSPPDIPAARRLYELSANAYDRFVHGWMSELPIEAELIRFAWKVLAAGQDAPGGLKSPGAREGAETAAADRGDPDVQAVLSAAYRVWKELDRLRGLLRFSPASSGIYLACCTPDHFVLPGLADHFTLRFGETPWVIIDERRSLALARAPGKEARLISLEDLPRILQRSSPHSIAVPGSDTPRKNDPWEDLWRNYHRVVNNESRSNPQLQRQFMPKRYWKYLPELRE